jgi:hypothetical protein
MIRTAPVVAAVVALGFPLGAGTAQAATIEVDAASIFSIAGTPGLNLGSAQQVGDVNGDGVDDAIVGRTDRSAAVPRTEAWVTFGRRGVRTDIDLSRLGSRGFRIVASGPRALDSVVPIGDVNGDGRDDLAVALAPLDYNVEQGRTRILLGGSSAAVVDVGVDGPQTVSLPDDVVLVPLGRGDINGDGFDDVFASRLVDPAYLGRDAAYLFGGRGLVAGASTGTVNGRLSPIVGDETASIVGDVNDDGIDDLGWPRRDFPAVVFGRRWVPGAPIQLAAASRLELPITPPFSRVVGLMSSAGDVNGDGRADVVVPAFGENDLNPGRAYVVFGRGPGTQSLDTLRAAGLTITGFMGRDLGSDGSVIALGDTNGDGRDDLLADNGGVPYGGGGVPPQLLAGRTQGGVIDATRPVTPIVRRFGTYLEPAWGVTPAGDLDGDGGADLSAAMLSNTADVLGRAAIIGGSDKIAPRLTAVGMTNTTFRTGPSPAGLPLGTTFYATFSEDVTLRLSLRRADGTKVTTVTGQARRGKRTLAFDGKVNGVPLAAGSYRLTPVTTDRGANTTVGPTLSFTVVG